MTFLKIKFFIFFALIFIISGCTTSRYDYSIHKPKVRFKPSAGALSRLERETYGRPYVWAAENDNCYDCSGLTYYTFGSMGLEIPRTADQQFHSGTPVSKSELQKGDLVFFGRRGRATHVGIYVGNGKFQHASSAKQRVIISSLDKPYYRRHYMGARRYYSFENVTPFKPQLTPTQPFKGTTIVQPSPALEYRQPSRTIVASSSKYYILAGTSANYPSELITKLELSGLRVNTKTQNGLYKVLVGPYDSISQAKQDLGFNPTLLANANIVRGN